MFHVSDGLYFSRLDATEGYGVGSVLIQKRAGTLPDDPVIMSVVIDAASWASIVSTVSSLGETGTTWAMALALQQGGRVDDSAIKTKPCGDHIPQVTSHLCKYMRDYRAPSVELGQEVDDV